MKICFPANSYRFVFSITITAGLLAITGCSKVQQFAASHTKSDTGIQAVDSLDIPADQVNSEIAHSTAATDSQFMTTGFVEHPAPHGRATNSGHSTAGTMLPSYRSNAATHSYAKSTTLKTLEPGENLDQLLKNADGLVLIDFYADWCGPCRRQGKILHEMESFAAKNNARIIKVNIDKHRDLATKYRVSSLPTLMAIKRGNLVNRRTGLADQQQIRSLLRM